MTSTVRPEIILGAGSLGTGNFADVEPAKQFCDLFHQHGHTRIDNAHIYPIASFGYAERLMVETGAVDWAVIDTKVTAMGAGAHSKEAVVRSLDASSKELKGAQIDVFYLHGPDGTTPLEETLQAVDQAHKEGRFKRLGLSNYSPALVKEIVHIAAQNAWVKPSVYQGHYNAVCRKAEKALFPVLRKHDISFFAFTPSGAGIFTGKVTRESVNQPSGRFSHNTPVGAFWSSAYFKDEILQASKDVQQAAKKHGLSGHAAALRWVLHHSMLDSARGDGMILGASTLEQLKENLEICEQGPLPGELVETIVSVWPSVEPVSPWAWLEVDSFKKATENMPEGKSS